MDPECHYEPSARTTELRARDCVATRTFYDSPIVVPGSGDEYCGGTPICGYKCTNKNANSKDGYYVKIYILCWDFARMQFDFREDFSIKFYK
ncbi:hypothetical protein GCM10008985_04600 [Halococcus dombrowskii]|uniref:Uncharacterized protein n=1 Tax=Halococcus dombrowskii TaxID=179637 RepID=A0AAV3SDH2_HALDO